MHHAFSSSALALAAFLAGQASGGSITSTWIGPRAGNWGNAANWDPSIVPLNGVSSFDVIIDGPPRSPCTVTLDLSSITIDGLTLGAGDVLVQPNNRSFTPHAVTNAGTWQMNSTGNQTGFIVAVPEVTLNGDGVLLMSNSSQNRVYGTGGVRRLINGPGHTIRGAGQVGLNTDLVLTNAGLIDATQITALVIDLVDAEESINTGVLQASGNGTLTIQGSAIDNRNGILRAIDSGVIVLSNATLIGGSFMTEDAGSIRLTTSASTLSGITIDGLLVQPNDAEVQLTGDVLNNGTWSMQSIGNLTNVTIAAPEVTIDGPGVISMSNSSQNRFLGAGGVRRLVNGAEHTIRGAGQLGLNNNLNLTNEGLIDADQLTSLVIDLVGGDNINNGELRASANGTLVLLDTEIENGAGVIRAIESGKVSLQGGSIRGGLLDTAGEGAFVLSSNDITLESVTSTGLLIQPNNADLSLAESITNDGTWRMESIGNATDVMLVTDEVTLDGAGELVMSNSAQNRIFGTGGVRRLVHASTHVIRGAGQIGVNLNLNLTNEGLIDASEVAALQIDLSDGVNTNTGVLQASGNGTLSLLNTPLDNTDGVIRAIDAGVVTLAGGSITGGTLETADNGVIRFTTNSITLSGITSTGFLQQPSNADLHLAGDIVNDGTWEMSSIGHATEVVLHADASLLGSGELVMSNSEQNRILGASTVRRLVNGPGHTIRGGGQIGLNNNLDFTNAGTVIADRPVGVRIDASDEFLNTGTLRAATGSSLTILTSAFDTTGDVVIESGASLVRHGTYFQTAGSTHVDGTLQLQSGGTVLVEGGTLSGNGTVTSTVTLNGGATAPGASTGTLSITGHYTQSLDGTLEIEIGGTDPGVTYDRLAIGGNATVAGTLAIRLVDGFEPAIGQSFVILTANSVNGLLGCIDADPLRAGYFRVVYGPGSITLTVVTTPPLFGDLNQDGIVNGGDLGILLASWSTAPGAPGCDGALCCPADLSGDGVVDGSDLGLLLAAWSS